MATTKVLTIGPPCGNIQDLLKKIKAINDKYGPFQVLLCLGDLFTPGAASLSQDEEALLDGTLKLPIPIYFALSTSSLHSRIQELVVRKWGGDDTDEPIEIAPNVFFLAKSGVYNVAGLRVAVAGGSWDVTKYNESLGRDVTAVEDLLNPFITSTSINKLLSHPAFRERKVMNKGGDEPAESLAAARAQKAAQVEALQEAQVNKPVIDVLFTTVFPTGITMFSNPEKLAHATSRMWGAPIIAQLARACTPRYHFSLAPGSCHLPSDDTSFGIAGLDSSEEGKDLRSNGVFWEREPYRNDQGSTTRFICLARFANPKKQRWFMALNLKSADNISEEEAKASMNTLAAGTTPSPYSTRGYGGGHSLDADTSMKRKTVEEEMDGGPNFRWSGNGSRGKKSKQRGGMSGLPSRPDGPLPDRVREKKSLAIPVGPQDCWFCLSNPQCAKHLIVAIGTECYVAMPKGQIPTTSDPLSPVPGGGHVLIIPIEHFPSLLGHPDPSLARPIQREMQSWRDALRKAYASFNALPVSWEVCKTIGSRAGHMQCQVVPIPKEQFSGVKDYFREAAKKWEYSFIEDQDQVRNLLSISDSEEDRALRCDYIRIDFDDQTWIMLLKDKRFYLQFPRETLASYLNVPDRADWKACARSEGIETAEARAFKSAFEEFSKDVGED